MLCSGGPVQEAGGGCRVSTDSTDFVKVVAEAGMNLTWKEELFVFISRFDKKLILGKFCQ